MLYACNRASNFLQSALGMALSIEGTSNRVIKSLSAMGLSVSVRTVDRIRERLACDALAVAKQVILSGRPWIFVYFRYSVLEYLDEALNFLLCMPS